MGRLALCLAVLLAAAPAAVSAQPVAVPAQPGFATNPLAPNSPLQQQMMQNYRSDLRQTQRELAVQNPSGLGREQLEVTRQLNAVNSALNPAPSSTVTPPDMPEPAPFQLR